MRVVFVAAHPDDIEFGCAGLVKKMHSRGDEISWVLLTDGENAVGADKAVRIRELELSARMLGVDRLIYLHLADGFVSDDAGTISLLCEQLEALEPDLVFTHYYEDRHQDHRKTAYCVLSACYGKFNLMYFRSYSSMNMEPSVYVDITEQSEVKQEALSCYLSQLKKFAQRKIDFIGEALAIDKKNGGAICRPYAEGFVPENCLWEI